MEPQIEIKEESFNYAAIFMRMLDNWYFYVISLILSLIGGYFFIKYTPSVYEVSTTMMIENESPSFSTERVLEDMSLFSQKRNIMNEKIILKSYDIINETLKELGFLVSYYSDNGYSLTELYNTSPFIVELDTASPQVVNELFEIEIQSDDKFRLKCKAEDVNLYSYQKKDLDVFISELDLSEVYAFNTAIKTPYFGFKVVRNTDPDVFPAKRGDKFKFSLNDLNKLTLGYKAQLNVDLYEKDVDVLNISLSGNNIAKTTDFLNKLTQVYIRKKLEKKNLNANNTIRFIDEQLFMISDSLMDAENRLQNFKSTSKLMDVGYQTQKLFEQLSGLEKDKAVLLTQKKYFDYTLNTLKQGANLDQVMIPSSIGIADANLDKLISELIELNSQKMALASNAAEKSQAIKSIEMRIENNKKLIVYNLNSLVENADISINSLNSQIGALENEAQKLPATQQKLFGFERQFALSNEIFNFLMQKRAEAQIAKASNTPDSEVVDVARTDVFKKVSTRYGQIMVIVVILALVIPSVLIFLQVLLKDTIIMRQDIEEITDIPIVGSIVQSKHAAAKAFIERPKSPIAESFRSFYTNLQYFIKGKEQQVILITSSLPQEGKTFNSINLALVYASFGKKTCLLSFDLRLAKVHKAFDISGEIGISTFLINYSTLDEITYSSGVDNLDVVPAGPVPPNPVELIASEKTMELFQLLKLKYQCIIIDSPPLGVVADALLLAKHSDVNVIIARQNHSRKKVLSSVVKELDANGIKNKAILFNGVKQSRISGYGYSYGYGYGYGYYHEVEKKWWKGIFSALRKWRKGK